MANLPAETPESSISDVSERQQETIAELVAQGKRPDEIAREVYPKDRRARRNLRRRIWYLVRYDDRFANRLGALARGEMLLSLVPATKALGERASRGRPDAAKLIYEASGFHNPRVKHEHSGEIKVKLDIPRPKFVDAEVTDAEVVD